MIIGNLLKAWFILVIVGLCRLEDLKGVRDAGVRRLGSDEEGQPQSAESYIEALAAKDALGELQVWPSRCQGGIQAHCSAMIAHEITQISLKRPLSSAISDSNAVTAFL